MLTLWLFIFFLFGLLLFLCQSEKVKAPQFIHCKRSCQRYLFRALWDAGFYPEVNYRIGSYEVDIAFPYSKVALVCGWNKWEGNDLLRFKIKKKQQCLTDLGWKVIHFSPGQIYGEPKQCVKRIYKEMNRKDLFV